MRLLTGLLFLCFQVICLADQDNQTVSKPHNFISNHHFVYGPDLLGFELEKYLAPHYAEIISHWSSYFSINPQVILTLIEMQTGLISDPTNQAVIEQPLGVLSKEQGFSAQVKDVLSRLFSDFYDHLGAGGDIAASYALVRLLGDTSDFFIVFGRLFEQAAPKLRNKYTAPPLWLMQFPWHLGESWYFNGVHTNSGRHDGSPMSSIDLTPSWKRRWGDDTSLDIVTAANQGIVSKHSSCHVRITSPDGWATQYYHLDDVSVHSGEFVEKNDRIGIIANNENQALCQGGHSTVPHLHFSLLKDGFYYSLSGTYLNDSLIHPGRWSYDSDNDSMWLEKGETKFYAYSDRLFNSFCTDDIPYAECEALFALYNSTDGANWSDNTGWLVTPTACRWFGISCSGGHVTRVVLNENQLSGFIPAELAKLSHLNTLVLNNNALCGNFPVSLMSQMASLKLDHNHLRASEPALISWLNSHNPAWDSTQTACSEFLTASAVNVAENAGTVSLTVRRFGEPNGTLAVNYATTDGRGGTVSWADGDSSDKTLTFMLSDDREYGGDETFTVTLSDPVSGVNLDSATVTISDNDTPIVNLISFSATGLENEIILEWQTASEIDNAGFHLWRATGDGWKKGDYSTVIRLTDRMIPAEGYSSSYSYIDSQVESGVTYYYGLEDIDLYGQSIFHLDSIASARVKI